MNLLPMDDDGHVVIIHDEEMIVGRINYVSSVVIVDGWIIVTSRNGKVISMKLADKGYWEAIPTNTYDGD